MRISLNAVAAATASRTGSRGRRTFSGYEPGGHRSARRGSVSHRAARHALAGYNRAVIRTRTAARSGPGARTGIAVALIAIGSILVFAVHGSPMFIDIPLMGLIVVAAGLSWLWAPISGKRAILENQLGKLRDYLGRDADLVGGARCSLDELLERQSGGPAGVHADNRSS